MILTFEEIGVDIAYYNGYSFEDARGLIINDACDYVMENIITDPSMDECDAIPWPHLAMVDMVNHIVVMAVNVDAKICL